MHLPPHNHIDHAQYFPNNNKKKFRRTNFTHKYRHTINSLESQQRRRVGPELGVPATLLPPPEKTF